MNARDEAARGTGSKGTGHPVRLAIADYDRTRPLVDGRVRMEGIDLSVSHKWIAEFCERPVYEEYDAAEMSMSWFVAARSRGEPVVALPIFPLRMPVYAYVLCRDDAPFRHPRDLIGRRIGVTRYRYTVNLWLRGLFSEHHGVRPEQLTWVTAGEEEAGYRIPPGIRVERRDGTRPEQLLEAGEVDAVFLARLPDDYLAGKTRMRRLFPDARQEMRSLQQSTGIVPVTHVVVLAEALHRREPWIARTLVDGLIAAQRHCDDFYLASSKHLSFPEAVFFLEEQRAIYGEHPWFHGLKGNARAIQTFVRYAHEQGYIDRPLRLDELFADNTLDY